MTSSAYNHSLLKTIRVPLHESLNRIASNLEAVLEASLEAQNIGAADINNVIGSVTMVGRPSLVVVANLLKDSLVALERSAAMAWDTIHIASVARPAMELTRALSELLVALERGDLNDQHLPGRSGEGLSLLGEASSSVQLAPLLCRLAVALGEPVPDLSRLFDPDPVFPGMEFAAIDPAALRDVAAVHVARLDQAVGEYLNIVPLPQENVTGTSLPPGQAFISPVPDMARGRILGPDLKVLSPSLQDLLNTVGAAADWAFVQKHRMGYQGYWLAWRARIAWELQKSALNEPTNQEDLGQALDSARTEMRKFAGDVRRPRPTAMFQVLEPLLYPWPKDWSSRVQPLADASKAFGLEMFWRARARAEKGLSLSSSGEAGRDQNNKDGDYQANFHPSFADEPEDVISPILADPLQAASWRSAVSDIQLAWTGFAAPPEGTKSDVMPLRRGLAMFLPRYEQASHTGSADFLAALKLTALHIDSEIQPRLAPEVVQEVAVLLVLLDDDIARVGRWPAEWPEKAALARARVQAAWSNQVDVLQALPAVVWDATRRRQQSQDAVSRIARVVQEDLRGVEEVFDEFIRRDAAEARTQADDVRLRLSRDASVMRAIGQNTAADVLDVVVQRSSALKKSPRDAASEMADVTVGLASVTAFLESFGRGAPDALSLLTSSRNRFGLKGGSPDHLFADFTGEALARTMLIEVSEDDEVSTEDFVAKEFAGNPDEANAFVDETFVDETVAPVYSEENSHSEVHADEFNQSFEEHLSAVEAEVSAKNGFSFDEPENFRSEEEKFDIISGSPRAFEPADTDTDTVQAATIQTDDTEGKDGGEVRQFELDAAQGASRKWMDGVLLEKVYENWTDKVIDKDIAEALFEEAAEVFAGLEVARQAWLASPTNAELLTDLRRSFHTIKGSGRTASLFGVGEYARVLEDRLTDVRDDLMDIGFLDQDLVSSIDALVEVGHQTLEMALDMLSADGEFTFTSEMLEDLTSRLAESFSVTASRVDDHDYEVQAEESSAAVQQPFSNHEEVFEEEVSSISVESADQLFDNFEEREEGHSFEKSGPESEAAANRSLYLPVSDLPTNMDMEPYSADPSGNEEYDSVALPGKSSVEESPEVKEDRDALLIDLDTHLESLIHEVEDSSGPSPGRLMWSAHTIKTLAGSDHPRLSFYARRLEELLEPWSELRDNETFSAKPWNSADRLMWRWHAATLVDIVRLWLEDTKLLDVWTLSGQVASENAEKWHGHSVNPVQEILSSSSHSQSDLIAVAEHVNKLADGMDQLGTLLERMLEKSGV